MGPCLCGDTHCPSCGPAQGNWRCPICRAWADDGCDHIDEDTGDIKKEFRELADQKAKEEDEAEAALAAEYDEDKKLAADYREHYDDAEDEAE